MATLDDLAAQKRAEAEDQALDLAVDGAIAASAAIPAVGPFIAGGVLLAKEFGPVVFSALKDLFKGLGYRSNTRDLVRRIVESNATNAAKVVALTQLRDNLLAGARAVRAFGNLAEGLQRDAGLVDAFILKLKPVPVAPAVVPVIEFFRTWSTQDLESYVRSPPTHVTAEQLQAARRVLLERTQVVRPTAPLPMQSPPVPPAEAIDVQCAWVFSVWAQQFAAEAACLQHSDRVLLSEICHAWLRGQLDGGAALVAWGAVAERACKVADAHGRFSVGAFLRAVTRTGNPFMERV